MEQDSAVQLNTGSTGVTRRAVVRSAAWSVPVVVTVAMTTAAATSTNVVDAGSMTAARGQHSQAQKTVTFTWEPSIYTGVVIRRTTSSQPEGFTVNDGTADGGVVTFTGLNSTASVITFPDFAITVFYTYGGQDYQETFSVTGGTVAEGASGVFVTVQ